RARCRRGSAAETGRRVRLARWTARTRSWRLLPVSLLAPGEDSKAHMLQCETPARTGPPRGARLRLAELRVRGTAGPTRGWAHAAEAGGARDAGCPGTR